MTLEWRGPISQSADAILRCLIHVLPPKESARERQSTGPLKLNCSRLCCHAGQDRQCAKVDCPTREKPRSPIVALG